MLYAVTLRVLCPASIYVRSQNGLPLVTEFTKMFIVCTYRNIIKNYSIHYILIMYEATCVHFSMNLVTHDSSVDQISSEYLV